MTTLDSAASRRCSAHPAAYPLLLLALAVVPLLAGCAATPAAAGTPAPTATLAPVEPSASPTELPTPTPSPTAPPPCVRYAATNGIPFACSQAVLATRKVIAVMIDDHWDARPQAGLSAADVVYQAPAEGGVPRYMALFQTRDIAKIGPVRSARLYFVSWASEWRAAYAHVGGAPDALRKLRQIDRKTIWNQDQYFWESYFWRSRDRFPPHNVYTTTARLRALAQRMHGTAPITTTPWTFVADGATVTAPAGKLVIPYKYNRISYKYDAATNRYIRSVTARNLRTQIVQKDALNGKVIAPANVIVLYVQQRLLPNLPGESTNVEKGRLDLKIIGSGKALVMRNGELVRATWTKAGFSSPTLLTYSSGCQAGQSVPLAPGQIFIQVVATSTKVVASGATPAPTC